MNESITVGALMERLTDFDQKEVSVRGILSVQRENHSLADTTVEDDPKRRVWVYFHHAALGTRGKDLPSYRGEGYSRHRYYRPKQKGHFGIFPTSITIRKIVFA